MKDYFSILGLEPDASESDIKRAYRSLAKRLHPDVNPHPDARTAFIAVNEAYEFLMDAGRRKYASGHRAMSETEKRRREERYRSWVNVQQQEARRRAAQHAEQDMDTFVHSAVFRTAMVLDQLYNYIFIAVGGFITASPIVHYFSKTAEEREEAEMTLLGLIPPVVLGLLFTLGIYMFLFKRTHERYQ